MSLITEETPPGLLFVPTSPEPHPTPQGDYERPETTTGGFSPPQRQAVGQKTSTVTGLVCGVCSEVSSKETAFRKHYGVVCCEACKCFFRRTVQMNRDYKCRYDGRCTIGRFPENMKQVCQACRFSQCIRAGMKIESVKKFPRKAGKEGKLGDPSHNGDMGREAKYQKVLKNFSKGKRRARTGVDELSAQNLPQLKQEKVESEVETDTDIILSTAAVSVSSAPAQEHQQLRYSPCSGTPLSNGSGLLSSACQTTHCMAECGDKRPAPDTHTLLSRMVTRFNPPSPVNPAPFSPPPLPQSAPYTPPSFHQYPPHPYSHPGSLVNSPESHPPSVYNSHTNTPYATPHATPHGTPVNSPLPSPTGVLPPPPPPPTVHHAPLHAYPPPSSSLLTLPAFTRHSNLLLSQNTGTVFLNSSSQVPFRVVPMAQPILPFMAPFPTFHQPSVQPCNGNVAPSPFSIVPIPSSTTARVSRPPPQVSLSLSLYDILQTLQPHEELPQPSLPPSESGEVEESLASAPPSARASPEPSFKTPSIVDGDTLPEAEVDEVLDSLRQRIRTMFSWAKSDVAGFEDLSPLDQKALLRRTVAELVMLGFARASIAFDGVLLLGNTGKVIRPTNSNSGVSAVASVTLRKLVEPLKVVNMDNKEYSLMMEIVLFNPESSCLRNREVVRAHRKRSHISLKEYTDNHSAGDLGRFGELMCLLTPLFEVSTEVTEQLRLEHFVHEGEARIDALLLMSMINGAEEVGAT